ncbi:Receptor-type guanylate cyclase gcy [Seminavis robusta]|uniref:Phosphodiesterase n=1 Tax=Seminavis robusta TaxID=568900 RepID=A0A9N8DFP4_9STRA|nr:Receptor-type guanylate cyclase gcy [Seminavis robusta]|eukprot:Sro97_g049790.1 Receptor-type guanylate cyclase gcy (1269) ;mRNA; f:3711-9383
MRGINGPLTVENLGKLDDLQEESLRDIDMDERSTSSLPASEEFQDEAGTQSGMETGSRGSGSNSSKPLLRWNKGVEGDMYGAEGDLLWKALVVTLLTMIGTAAGFIYLFGLIEGDVQTAERFQTYAVQLQHRGPDQAKGINGLLATWTDHASSYATEHSDIWPFHRFAHFSHLAHQQKQLHLVQDSATATQVEWIASAPLISNELRANWEMYSAPKSIETQHQHQHTATIHYYDSADQQTVPEPAGSGPFTPLFQMDITASYNFVPFASATLLNLNLLSIPAFTRAFSLATFSSEPVLSEPLILNEYLTQFMLGQDAMQEPYAFLLNPILNGTVAAATTQTQDTLGVVVGLVPYKSFMQNIISKDANGIFVGVAPSKLCSDSQQNNLQKYTFSINGPNVEFKGEGDKHDTSYNFHEKIVPWDPFLAEHLHVVAGENNHTIAAQTILNEYFQDIAKARNDNTNYCPYELRMYPSDAFYNGYRSDAPRIFAAFLVGIFLFVYLILVLYNYIMKRKDKMAFAAVQKSAAIVDMFFPKEVKDRLLEEQQDAAFAAGGGGEAGAFDADNSQQFVPNEGDAYDINRFLDDKPIASLFPETTVIFADIAGFTAWSSEREPSQVFILLETIYGEFDKIAKRRKVFKVETIGDCYLAVTGIPDPQEEHAVIMCQFARECMSKMYEVTAALELTLGPDTSDLAMRMGLHSGPVTAGVLRGRKSHFQLFGDTVNTAARMESTGTREKIQISQETAELVRKSGRGHWIKERENAVEAKGKGCLSTFWLLPRTSKSAGSVPSSGASCSASSISRSDALDADSSFADDDDSPNCVMPPSVREERKKKKKQHKPRELSNKSKRLVQWNVALLVKILQKVVSGRKSYKVKDPDGLRELEQRLVQQHTVLGEVEEVIHVSKSVDERKPSMKKSDTKRDIHGVVEIPQDVVAQLTDYVSRIALLHPDNHFHNFEHASHVTMSTSKLLSRIVNVDETESKAASTFNAGDVQLSSQRRHAHGTSYGITSEPLTQFSVVFAALIHDVDHPGVSNAILATEEPEVGDKYKNKSVAEQKSLDIAFTLLMEDDFRDLRHLIYTNEKELMQFRQLMVNSVIATDIFDREHSAFRKARWAKAFAEGESIAGLENEEASEKLSIDRKATIVIEHLIQASDVSHTMQHWHVYQKWNSRLFEEMFEAFRSGRSTSNPAENWYKGELWFFDNYVIPLAKKLETCGVFGVSSDEFLNYANENRKEWAQKGEEIVSELVAKIDKMSDEDAMQSSRHMRHD